MAQSRAEWNAQGELRASGQRRHKVLGYIKAANELRQSYQQSISNKWQEGDYDEGIPGGFPDVDLVRNGQEEMLLFPSYARRHRTPTHPSQNYSQATQASRSVPPGAREDVGNPESGDADYWRREWEKYEDENAVVDVDVRGWIYTPQRGPLGRRNRLVVAVARRLSGIPAPNDTSPGHSRESSQAPGWRNRLEESMLGHEEEAAVREAQLIERRGEKEAEAASKGKYAINNDTDSLIDISPATSRPSSPRPNSASFDPSDDASLRPIQKRQSWNTTNGSQMSREEILAANEQLMTRLRPFMTLPLANTPITIFFFNDSKSQSKSVYTDDSGHFKVRAALDFVPTKVRVLASEKLSATEDVVVTDSKGISIVSDIDDTIKHSAIASGAKEIFKNTFIRDLDELTVPGVKEWYSKMASMGVKLHYVSNSPWQLYPLLRSYFALAGLPSGSFHLKQYSGMLQGIFEPAAERKKGSLDRIMHDFPERKFILIGDSGEADLEVYTDIVQEHPGRVLGVFIRDVSSGADSSLKDFFWGSHPGDAKKPMSPDTTDTTGTTIESSQEGRTPRLPERPKPQRAMTDDLIDFSDEPSRTESPLSSYSMDLEDLKQNERSPPARPARPAKPSNLRSLTTMSPQPATSSSNDIDRPRQHSDGEVKKNPPPPPAPAPRRTNTGLSTKSTASTSTNGSNNGRFYANAYNLNTKPAPPAPPAPPASRDRDRTLWQDSSHHPTNTNSATPPSPTQSPGGEAGYLASARHQLSAAYNSIPPLRSTHSSSSLNTNDPSNIRRGLSSYPAAAARYVTGASGGDPAAGGDGGAPAAPYDKKLDMWKRRWARSEGIMKRQGTVLKMWRSGTDVMGLCTRLVEGALGEFREEDEKNKRWRRGREVVERSK
ncbi:hypothetical protein LTR70_001056 [Exophiala xenobiotica]|uniref:Phosphatidate phosphatase APP1 catalytic domain-containing protein n=1 Tax=Lithohypha guttulata TaxID=1690604 RepID=A0ABR0KMV2_9EURO|nr:hypothetical protein LTR24_000755 [Lithohypha guttulata]KAK5328902.1 hypothetical protein LTR70_001056 [Exophiala xenobiotica]